MSKVSIASKTLNQCNKDNSVARDQGRQLYLFMMEKGYNCNLYQIGDPPADSSDEAIVRHFDKPLLKMDKPFFPEFPAYTAIGHRIFMIGGYYNLCSSNKVFIYDTSSSKVVPGPDLNSGKRNPYLFTFGSKIFALSHFISDEKESNNTPEGKPWFEMWDTDTNDRDSKWSPLPVPMLHVSSKRTRSSLCAAAAVLVNGSPVIFISLENAGTYCFEVDNLVWYYLGTELLPIDGNAVSIPHVPSMCCGPSLNSERLSAFRFCYEGNGKGFQVNEIMVHGCDNLPSLGGPPLTCQMSLPLVFGPDNRVYFITTGVDEAETWCSPAGNRYVKVYALDFGGINLDLNVPRSFKKQKLIGHGEDQDETTEFVPLNMCTDMDMDLLIGLAKEQDETVEVALNKGQSSKSWEGNNETTWEGNNETTEVNISKGQLIIKCGNEKREMEFEDETKEFLKLVELSSIWGECFSGGRAVDETLHVLGAIAMTMIGLVFDVHEMEFCLKESTFKVDNIVISRDELVFKKLYLEENFSEAGCLKNLLSVKSFIETNCFGGFSNIPLDAKHLLGLMASNPTKDRLLIYNHFSLMNEMAKRSFIDACFKVQQQYNASQKIEYYAACDLLSHNDDWETLWETNSTLRNVYEKGQTMNLYDPDYRQKDDQPKFYRNAIAHLIEHCRLVRDLL